MKIVSVNDVVVHLMEQDDIDPRRIKFLADALEVYEELNTSEKFYFKKALRKYLSIQITKQ